MKVDDAPAPVDRDASSGDARSLDTEPLWNTLMARAQDGDRAAYETLLLDISPYVRAIARRCLGQCEEVEDAVQEILMVVHRIRHTYDRRRPFKPWLGTIASRRAVDLVRRRSRRIAHHGDVPYDEWNEPACEEPLPEEHATAGSEHDLLRRAIAGLPSRQREAVELLTLNDLPAAEAARHTTQSAGGLRVAYHRALKSLRVILGDERAASRNRKPND